MCNKIRKSTDSAVKIYMRIDSRVKNCHSDSLSCIKRLVHAYTPDKGFYINIFQFQ